MSTKPLPRTLEPDDERKVQMFLERASSIILEHRVLDAGHWRALQELARELDLSDEQLRATVQGLQQRGVISQVELEPLRPPPRPNLDADSAEPEPRQESTFALTPPVRPRRPPKPPALPRPAAPPPQPQPPPPPERSPLVDQTLTPAPEAAPTKAQTPPAAARRSPREELRARAAAIVAEQRGVTGRALTLITAAADELGLAEADVEQVLQQLPSSSSTVPVKDEAPDSKGRRRWRVEGEPDPEPPPPSRKPEELYREFLNASLARIQNGVVTADLEETLVKHGRIVLGLAPKFARHLLWEEAERKLLKLESTESQTAPADRDDGLDPAIRTFLERATPILSQHQGITARSRVLLNALAHELGLSDEQFERAISTAQRRAATENKAEVWLRERLEAFQSLATGTLASLPRKVLTPDITRSLLRHAEEAHGLPQELAATGIRQVCKSLGISQISEQEAREHVEQLVDVQWEQALRMSPAARARIQTEGEQWGLAADEVLRIIQERCRTHQQRHQSEHRLATAALWGAAAMLLLLVAFFTWIWLERSWLARPAATSAPSAPSEASPDGAAVPATWMTPELQAQLAFVRADLGGLWRPLTQVESNDYYVRGPAYQQLVEALLASSLSEPQRELLLQALASCYAADPDPATAQRILSALLAVVPQSPDQMRADDELYRQVFLATRAAATLAARSAGERQDSAMSTLGRILGRRLHTGLAAAALERECLLSLAKHLYQLLSAMLTTQPSLVAGVHRVLAVQTTTHLDASEREQLDVDFLTALLAIPGDTWREFRPLIQQTIESGNPLHVVRLLELYERSSNAALQEFMTGLFRRRAGTAARNVEVAVVAREVRKALGINDTITQEQRTRKFIEQAERLLAQRAATARDPEILLEEMVRLAHAATQGCALSRGAAGAAVFDALSEQDPVKLLSPASGSAVGTPPSAVEMAAVSFLNSRLTALSQRTSPVDRIRALESVAEVAGSGQLSDLTADQAKRVAEYLLMRKRADEHQRVVAYVPGLVKWNAVRLAIADHLDAVGLDREQLQQLVAEILGSGYKLGEGAAGREALRVDLLKSALARLEALPGAKDDKSARYDAAAAALAQLYQTQGKLLGLAAAEGAPTPVAALRSLLESWPSQLATSKLDPAQKQTLDQMRARLQAIDYVSANDLQRQVLLERCWLDLLVIAVGQKQPSQRTAAQSLLEALAVEDRKATHILTQFRQGQATAVRLWLLWNQPERETP